MITLTGGSFQDPTGAPVAWGSITFELNVDCTIVSAPYGIIPGNAGSPVNFQLDASGNILPNTGTKAQLFSNAELNPQNARGYGSWYSVAVYDRNGARMSEAPLTWQFQNAANSTVNLSEMQPFQSTGGNVVYYPIINNNGGVSSVAFVGNGIVDSSTPSTPVTTSGNITATPLTQNANYVLAGPTTGAATTPTFRLLVAADLPAAAHIWSSLTAATADLTLANTTFNTTFNHTTAAPTWTWANITAATSGANQSSPTLQLAGTGWNGSASAVDSWTLQNNVGSGSNPEALLTLTHAGPGGGLFYVSTAFECAGGLIVGSNGEAFGGMTLESANATSSANVSSYAFSLTGSWWNGSAAVADLTAIQEIIGSGSTPTSVLTIYNTGAYSWGGVSIVGNLLTQTLQTTGLLTKYNNITTAGNGIPAELFQVLAPALTNNYNAGVAKTLVVPSAAGMWRVSWSQSIVVVDGASSTFPSLTLSWTDVGGIARTQTLVATSATNTTAVTSNGEAYVYSNSSTAIQVTSASYASGTPNTMTFSLALTCEKL
jgi:hypothetical protein